MENPRTINRFLFALVLALVIGVVFALVVARCSKPASTSPPQSKVLKKYDILSDYCRFECEPGVYIPVDCVSTGKAELDEKNVRMVETKWKDIWPATFKFLKELRKAYKFDTNITPASMRAKLMLADTVMSEDANWEVSFTFSEDGYSEWGVAFKGSEIDRDSSHPYF